MSTAIRPETPHHEHDHEHEHGDALCCSHHDIELDERKLILYLVGGTLVLTTVLAKAFGWAEESVAMLPALIGALVLGWPLFVAAAKETWLGRPTSSSLAALAIIAALAVGRYETAGFLAFILLVADQVVRRTASGAKRAIEQLVRLTPDEARIVVDGQEREAKLSDVAIGDVVRVRPGENLPVDGTVVAGRSTIDQASLTGESAPVEVQAGESVYAGTSNLTGQIDLKVTAVGGDTTIGRVTQLVHEAEDSRSPRQLLIEQVAAYFVPVAISVAGLVWYFMSQSPDPNVRDEATLTAITVLVVVCPSALLLASPTAMVSAFAAAARLGIMIKQTSYLEAASHVDTVVLDKTGTLTTGVFAVSRLVPSEGVDGVDLLQGAVDGEQHSNHPLAKSIMQTAKAARVTPATSDDFEEVHGRGVRARTPEDEVLVGRANWLVELNPKIEDEVSAVEKRLEGMTGVHVMRGDRYLGAVGLEDRLRSNAKASVERMRELGVRRVGIFTGDRAAVANRVGGAVGVDFIEAECLPEDKYQRLEALAAQNRRVMMVGDGINDGPSLAKADVGVAMGLSGSDIAANSAGVALMNDDLSRVPFLIELARKTRVVVAQNIVAAIFIALIGLVLAATGSLTIFFAAFYHFVGDVFVIGNSFRLIRFGEEFASTDGQTAPVFKAEEAEQRAAPVGAAAATA